MASDLIRLVLVVLGVLLVVGIYLWDRYKRSRPRNPMVRRASPELSDRAVAAETLPGEPDAEDPRIGTMPETPSAMDGDEDTARSVPAAAGPARPRRASALDPEPEMIGSWVETAKHDPPQFAMDLNFDAHDDADYLHADPSLRDEVERKLIVLHLVGRDGDLHGTAIDKACLSAHLRLGEMAIYHYHDGATGKVLFSVASMVEPGSFPADDMAHFRTPGLSLFTQLPGARDGLQIFESMLKAGRQLASLLDAELRDERHNKLTGQMERHLAESVIEHRHRLKVARSRH